MGSTIKSAGRMLGIGGGNTPQYVPTKVNHKIKDASFGPVNEDLEDKYRDIGARGAEDVEGIDQRESRARQTSLAEALEASARGEGPSVADQQLRSASDRSLANQLAVAASTRGGTSAAARRALMNNQAATNQDLARNSAELRLREQMEARTQLGNLASQMREQDAVAQLNALNLEGQSLGDIAAIREANRAAAMNLENLKTNQGLGVGSQVAADTINRRDNRTAITGQIIKGIGSGVSSIMGMMSDERIKKNSKDGSGSVSKFLDALEDSKRGDIKAVADHTRKAGEAEARGDEIEADMYRKLAANNESDAEKSGSRKRYLRSMSDESQKKKVNDGSGPISLFLDALEAKKFEYKEPDKFGEGERLGVMAQDVEDGGPIGKALVAETPNGKALDMAKGFGAILAAQAELHKRLKAVESKKRKA